MCVCVMQCHVLVITYRQVVWLTSKHRSTISSLRSPETLGLSADGQPETLGWLWDPKWLDTKTECDINWPVF